MMDGKQIVDKYNAMGSENPQLAAMKQAAYLRFKCDITCQIVFNDDGTVTVQGTALAPITYEQANG